jgi:hypothetical protein
MRNSASSRKTTSPTSHRWIITAARQERSSALASRPSAPRFNPGLELFRARLLVNHVGFTREAFESLGSERSHSAWSDRPVDEHGSSFSGPLSFCGSRRESVFSVSPCLRGLTPLWRGARFSAWVGHGHRRRPSRTDSRIAGNPRSRRRPRRRRAGPRSPSRPRRRLRVMPVKWRPA